MFTPFFLSHSPGGEIDPQFARDVRKNGNTGFVLDKKYGSKVCIRIP